MSQPNGGAVPAKTAGPAPAHDLPTPEPESPRTQRSRKPYQFATLCATVDNLNPSLKDQHGSSSVPIYQTATFKGMGGEFDYSRSGNPTRSHLGEWKIHLCVRCLALELLGVAQCELRHTSLFERPCLAPESEQYILYSSFYAFYGNANNIYSFTQSITLQKSPPLNMLSPSQAAWPRWM